MSGTPLGYIKSKLGLKGPTRPGQMIERMNAIKSGKIVVAKPAPKVQEIIKKII